MHSIVRFISNSRYFIIKDMIARNAIFYFIFLVSICCFSQKAVEKRVYAKGITLIDIDAQNVYKVSIKTHASNDVLIATVMDGEYQNEFINTIKEDGTTLYIGVENRPLFDNPNDKLSAHKVVAVALGVIVPAYKQVQITGNYTQVYVEGAYDNLRVSTENEMVYMKNTLGNLIQARTRNGNIVVKNSKGNFEAISKYGKVYIEKSEKGNTKFELNSLNGNIYINKIE